MELLCFTLEFSYQVWPLTQMALSLLAGPPHSIHFVGPIRPKKLTITFRSTIIAISTFGHINSQLHKSHVVSSQQIGSLKSIDFCHQYPYRGGLTFNSPLIQHRPQIDCLKVLKKNTHNYTHFFTKITIQLLDIRQNKIIEFGKLPFHCRSTTPHKNQTLPQHDMRLHKITKYISEDIRLHQKYNQQTKRTKSTHQYSF